MAIEYAGRGDPARTFALLWRTQEPPSRGPKPGLTLDQIVAASIELADADGLAALSMRRVAEKLGVGTMTLYRYVPGKGELLDVMMDTVIGDYPMLENLEGSLRDKLEAYARHDWEFYHRHPWMLHIAADNRPVLGPNTLRAFEVQFAALSGHGLTDSQVLATLSILDGFVRGIARGSVQAMEAEQSTGISDEQWWEERNWFWERFFDPEKFPAITKGYAEGAFEASPTGFDEFFEFGLQRLLDGYDLFVSRSEPGREDATPVE